MNQDYQCSVDDGIITIVKYTGNDKELVIPSEIDNLPVLHIGKNAFERCKSLTVVTFPENLESIQDFAFRYCIYMHTIRLPKNLIYIGKEAFYSCGLTSLYLPDSIQYIGNRAFFFCSSLHQVNGLKIQIEKLTFPKQTQFIA
jgi:hypothetical protein